MQMNFKASLGTPEVSPVPDGGYLLLCSDPSSRAQRGGSVAGALHWLEGAGCDSQPACLLTPASHSCQLCAAKSVLSTLHS